MNKVFCGVITFMLLCLPSMLVQAACQDSSPLVREGREPYENLIPKPLEAGDYSQLERFARGIAGRYKGSYKDTICFDQVDVADKVTRASAEVGIEWSIAADLKIRLELDAAGVSWVESLVYELKQELLTSKETDGTVNTVIERLLPEELVFNFKTSIPVSKMGAQPHRKVAVGRIPVEQTVRIKKNRKQLRIEIDTYHHGKLVGSKALRLLKR